MPAVTTMKEDRFKDIIRHVSSISLATVVCYLNALECDFSFDDKAAIKENKDLRPTTPIRNLLKNDFWGTPIHTERSHKSYRPITVASFRMNFSLHGLEPFGFHLTNLILHLIVCLLYYRFCIKFVDRNIAFLAALLFSIHPIHTEAVTSVVGRAELLSAIFYLLAFLRYLSNHKVSSNVKSLPLVLALSAFAMLSKEQGITVIPLCILTDVFVLRKVKINVHIWMNVWSRNVMLLLLCLFMLCIGRTYVMNFTLPSFNRYDNPASVARMPAKQMTFSYLAAYNCWLLLFPSSLCCDWTMASIPIVNSCFDIRNIFTVAFIYSFYKFLLNTNIFDRYKATNKISILGLLMTVIPFLPASNIFVNVGFVIAERVLYLPSMGFCLLVAQGFHNLKKRYVHRTNYISAALIVLLISHAYKTMKRNNDWKTERGLFESAININPRNAKLLNNLGFVYESSELFQEAIFYYQQAIRVQADDVGGYINIGRVYNTLKLYDQAENTLRKGKSMIYTSKWNSKLPINHLKVFITLGNVISQNTSRLREADQLYKEAIDLREDFVEAYLNKGDVLLKLNRVKEAKETYKKALQYKLQQADLYYNLAIISVKEDEILQALDYLNKALDIEPDHEPSLLNSAMIIQQHRISADTLTAYHRLLKLVESHNTYDENIYFNLGMLSLTAGSSWNAEYWLRKAIQAKEDFKSALFNLALLLSDEERPLEAVTFINQLLKFHPNHTKALILMGDIYVNNMNDLESAEQCYNRILEIDPTNVQGLHNLCVIHYKKSKLLQAEKCLVKALKLAPNKDYLLKHLDLVRNELRALDSSSFVGKDILNDNHLLNAFEISHS